MFSTSCDQRTRQVPYICEPLETRRLLDGSPELVRDINVQAADGWQVGEVVTVGSTVFFTRVMDTATQLWKSTGTQASTVLVKDDVGATNLVSFSGALYFSGSDATNGRELWKSDGTATGTNMLRNINSGSANSNPNGFVVSGGFLYFVATDATAGTELFRTNGTLASTIRLSDINPGTASSNAGGLINANGTLFFYAHNPTLGFELYKSDGSVAGTVNVIDLNPGAGQGSYASLEAMAGEVYFDGYDGTNRGLWKSNGTAAGTVVLGAFGSLVGTTQVGSKIFYLQGTSLRTSDGTPAGNVLVKSLPSDGYYNFTSVNGKLVFHRGNAASAVHELWCSDGTSGGTTAIKTFGEPPFDVNPLTNSRLNLVNGLAYFGSSNGLDGMEIWTTDGTAAGTTMLKDLNVGLASGMLYRAMQVAALGGSAVFAAFDGYHPSSLYKSNGTAAGTELIDVIYSGATESADITSLQYFGALSIFVADDGVHGKELWRSDGTAAGTFMLAEIGPGSIDGLAAMTLSELNGVALIRLVNTTSVHSVNYYTELWRTDGTVAGTYRLQEEILPEDLPLVPTSNGTFAVYSALNDAGIRHALFVTDGTLAGTVELFAAGNEPGNFLSYNGKFIFSATKTSVTGKEAWVTDGTAAGTFVLKDINPGAADSNPVTFRIHNGVVLFTATDPVNGQETWRTDGTALGTVMLKDINPGSGNSGFRTLGTIGTNLYFGANDGVNGEELWKTDGTLAGTVLVKDINPGAAGAFSSSASIGVVGTTLYFAATNGVDGTELWKTDGTASGTVMVKDIVSGSGSSTFRFLGVLDTTLFLVVNTPTYGNEPWVTDGTAAGTTLLADVVPGTGGSLNNPIAGLVNNGAFFFQTYTGSVYQLYRSSGTPSGTVRVAPANLGSTSPTMLAHDGRLYYFDNDGISGMTTFSTDGTAASTQPLPDPVQGGTSVGILSPIIDGNQLKYAAGNTQFGTELFTLDLSDTTAPKVISGTFDPTQSLKVTLEFSERISPPSITAADLLVTNLTTGASFVPTSINRLGFSGIFEFQLPASVTPGNYRFRLNAGSVADGHGNSQTIPYELTGNAIYVLPGDANRDRFVDTQDFNLLAANFGSSGKVFSQGNFDYDGLGQVNSVDFGILVGQYGKRLPAPLGVVGAAPTIDFPVAALFAAMSSQSSDEELFEF